MQHKGIGLFFLGIMLSMVLKINVPANSNPNPVDYTGGLLELDYQKEQAQDPNLLGDIPQEWEGSGKGKTRLLYQDYQKVHGHAYIPRNQGNAPSCVGHATAGAVDILAAVQIVNGQAQRPPPAQASAEAIYGLSRIEIGKVKGNFGGGSHCVWSAKAIQQYGVVLNRAFPLLGIDLSEPSPSMAVKLGRTGLPTSLEVIAKKHPVHVYVHIKTWDEFCDAMNQGCPIIVGSKQGFGKRGNLRRDKDGFLNPPRSMFWPSVWRHALFFHGYTDEGRKGGLCQNSWGANWVKGPKRNPDQPDGSFWVDKHIVKKMLAHNDSYALMQFQGFALYKLW